MLGMAPRLNRLRPRSRVRRPIRYRRRRLRYQIRQNRVPDPSQRSQLGRDAADARNAADTNENQQEKDNRRKDDDESLSKRLDENEGVIEPPRDGDSEIVEPAPDTDAKIKMIPAAGEPGGDPNIQPK